MGISYNIHWSIFGKFTTAVHNEKQTDFLSVAAQMFVFLTLFLSSVLLLSCSVFSNSSIIFELSPIVSVPTVSSAPPPAQWFAAFLLVPLERLFHSWSQCCSASETVQEVVTAWNQCLNKRTEVSWNDWTGLRCFVNMLNAGPRSQTFKSS